MVPDVGNSAWETRQISRGGGQINSYCIIFIAIFEEFHSWRMILRTHSTFFFHIKILIILIICLCEILSIWIAMWSYFKYWTLTGGNRKIFGRCLIVAQVRLDPRRTHQNRALNTIQQLWMQGKNEVMRWSYKLRTDIIRLMLARVYRRSNIAPWTRGRAEGYLTASAFTICVAACPCRLLIQSTCLYKFSSMLTTTN